MQYQYGCVLMAVFGTATGYCLADTIYPINTTMISGIWPEDDALSSLVEGGYVVDLRPFKDTPKEITWLNFQPSGMLDNGEQIYLSNYASGYADQVLDVLNGNMPYTNLYPIIPVPLDIPSLSVVGFSSAQFYALAWASRGAHVGRRQGDQIIWVDAAPTAIPTPVTH